MITAKFQNANLKRKHYGNIKILDSQIENNKKAKTTDIVSCAVINIYGAIICMFVYI